MNEQLLERIRNGLVDSAAMSSGSRGFGFYWTRKDINISERLVRTFLPSGGRVIDPFLGSGSTAIACARAGSMYSFSGCDVNEMPVEVLKFNLGMFDRGEALSQLAEISKWLDENKYRYAHKDRNKEIVYASKLIFNRLPTGLELRAVELQKSKSAGPIVDQTDLLTHFSGVINSESKRVAMYTSLQIIENSRIAAKSKSSVSDYFDPIAYALLKDLREHFQNSKIVRLLIAGKLHLCRLSDRKSQSQFPFWHPKVNCVSQNAVRVLQRGVLEMRAAIDGRISSEEFTEDRINVEVGDVRQVLAKPEMLDSADLLITDPPYFDQVAYSEYLQIWDDLTGFKADIENEIVQSDRKKSPRTRQQFLSDLGEAFTKTRNAMKNGAPALVYFKDSKFNNLEDFLNIMSSSGFVFEGIIHVGGSSFTYKQNSSKSGTVGGDAIYLFSAAAVELPHGQKNKMSSSELNTLVTALFEKYISRNGPSTITEAFDNSLIWELHRKGVLGQLGNVGRLTKILESTFEYDPVTRNWSKN